MEVKEIRAAAAEAHRNLSQTARRIDELYEAGKLYDRSPDVKLALGQLEEAGVCVAAGMNNLRRAEGLLRLREDGER